MSVMISANLRLLRARNRYTLEDVADIVGVSRQAVARWEQGETYPDIENCLKLSRLYKVTLDALVKEPLNLTEGAPREDGGGRYLFGVVRVSDGGEISLTKEAMDIFEILPGDRLLMVGDREKGIAIVKCSGLDEGRERGEKDGD